MCCCEAAEWLTCSSWQLSMRGGVKIAPCLLSLVRGSLCFSYLPEEVGRTGVINKDSEMDSPESTHLSVVKAEFESRFSTTLVLFLLPLYKKVVSKLFYKMFKYTMYT